MQTVSSLNEIKKWFEKLIEKEKIQFKQPSQDNKAVTYTLTAPAVHIGFVPPNGILDPGGMRIPCLVVGTPETDGDQDSTIMELQITAIVYDPGEQKADSDHQLQLTPNFDGYITLLNFLDRVKVWIQREDGIADRFQLQSPVKLKTYEEQPWPYWYGFLSLTVSGAPYPVTKYADVLN